ncbi:MAG: S41 family peptidase, partial [Pseudomonadota bacterium]
VLSINGRSIAELIEEYSLLVAASNPSTLTREVDRLLNQGSGAASLRVRRDGIEQVIETRYQLIGQRSLYENTQPYFAMDQQACSVGYVDMGLLSTPDVAPMMATFNNKDAIVFDLRNYPNGTLWTLVDYLYSGPIQVASFGFPEISSPGDYSQRGATIGSFHFNDIYSGRVLILMNEETQSQAEYTIMGLEQHPNAVKIGSQTAAADGDIAEVKLPGNISTWFTALGVYYPDRTPTQRVGIVPDLFIRPTIDGVSRGEDEVLNSALNCQNIRNSDWPTDPEPRAGLYWDPDKSGKGIDIHAANGNHVIYAYDFREDGSPVWYQGFSDTSSGALRIDQGSLFEYTYDYGNRTVEALTPDDTMRFDFKRGVFEIDCAEGSPELLTSPAQLLWQTEDGLESRCLEKMRFSFAPTPINYTGLWYGGPEDSGWGFSISHEGDVMVVLLYYYDDAGQATWAIASGVRDGNSPLTMGLIQVAGFCIICEVQEVELTEIGTLTISLTSNSEDSADNWVSLQLDDDSPWNRDRMPISRLTAPVEDA